MNVIGMGIPTYSQDFSSMTDGTVGGGFSNEPQTTFAGCLANSANSTNSKEVVQPDYSAKMTGTEKTTMDSGVGLVEGDNYDTQNESVWVTLRNFQEFLEFAGQLDSDYVNSQKFGYDLIEQYFKQRGIDYCENLAFAMTEIIDIYNSFAKGETNESSLRTIKAVLEKAEHEQNRGFETGMFTTQSENEQFGVQGSSYEQNPQNVNEGINDTEVTSKFSAKPDKGVHAVQKHVPPSESSKQGEKTSGTLETVITETEGTAQSKDDVNFTKTFRREQNTNQAGNVGGVKGNGQIEEIENLEEFTGSKTLTNFKITRFLKELRESGESRQFNEMFGVRNAVQVAQGGQGLDFSGEIERIIESVLGNSSEVAIMKTGEESTQNLVNSGIAEVESTPVVSESADTEDSDRMFGYEIHETQDGKETQTTISEKAEMFTETQNANALNTDTSPENKSLESETENLFIGLSDMNKTSDSGVVSATDTAVQVSKAVVTKVFEIAEMSGIRLESQVEKTTVTKFEVTLNPAHLGKVEVKLEVKSTLDGMKMSVLIIAANEQVRELLTARAQSVRVMVELSGVVVERYEVVTAETQSISVESDVHRDFLDEEGGGNQNSREQETGEQDESGYDEVEVSFAELVHSLKA